MKVSSIIRDIEYIHPAGELDKYKYGVKPVGSSEAQSKDSEILTQVDFRALKKELSSTPVKPKADFELVKGN